MTSAAPQPVPLPEPRLETFDGAVSTSDKAYYPPPEPETQPSPRSEYWFYLATAIATALLSVTMFWAFRAPTVGLDENAPALAGAGAASATSLRLATALAPAVAAPESLYVPPADGLVPYDPAALAQGPAEQIPAGPAPLLAGAGPAMDPQTAQAPSLQPAPLATSYPASRERANIVPPAPQTAAFRPARRLMPAGSFLAWNRGALRTAAPAASGVAPAEAQASAHVAAPMAALLARAAERCDHCRGALPADRLPDLSMLTGQQRQPVPSGLLALVGECDGQFLYSVTNRTGSEMSFELRDANTGEGWDISHLRPGETRNIRSSVHLKLP